MIAPDRLRPPSVLDPEAAAYKDWLHLNVFDHHTGTVGLVNLSLHGPPTDRRSRVVGAALVHVPGQGWVGDLTIRGWDEADVGWAAIALDEVALSVDHRTGVVGASARLRHQGLALALTARATEPALVIERRLPLGSGWVSWYVAPRLQLSGVVATGDGRRSLRDASAYHDNNWGRWHWGDDLGWEWGSFLAPSSGPTVVVARTTDRDHRRHGAATVVLRVGRERRLFSGGSVSLRWSGELDPPPVRLPGAMAALHQDRGAPRLPSTLVVTADDGHDAVTVEFTARGAAQLILADPVQRGYGFLHELVGSFRCQGRVGGSPFAAEGLSVVEYLN